MSPVIDGVLKDWGERLFPEPVHGRKGRNIKGGARPARKAKRGLGTRARLALTVSKAPEVVVKVSGGGKNLRHIKAHLDYISRNGTVALEDETGAVYRGADEVEWVRDAWGKGRIGIPEVGDKRREAFNIILSMPPGTDRASVKAAARQFAAELFGNHQYVFAEHQDEKHPHVHLAVKAVDNDGVRLNPRKADLQRWREHFADKLREHGIYANATPRRARCVFRKAEKQAVRHMRAKREKGGLESPSRVQPGGTAEARREVASGVSGPNPAAEQGAEARTQVVQAYGALARALASSESPADQRLAQATARFAQELAPAQPQRAAAVAQERRRGGAEPALGQGRDEPGRD